MNAAATNTITAPILSTVSAPCSSAPSRRPSQLTSVSARMTAAATACAPDSVHVAPPSEIDASALAVVENGTNVPRYSAAPTAIPAIPPENTTAKHAQP